MAMRSTLTVFAVLLGVLVYAPITKADDIAERRAIYDAVRADLKQGDFASLDRLAEQKRSENAVGSAGVPLLGEFYLYVEGDAPVYAPDSKCGASEEKTAQAWLKVSPQSVAAQIVHAHALVDLAFCARGGDFADKVTPTAWPIFQRYIEQAKN